MGKTLTLFIFLVGCSCLYVATPIKQTEHKHHETTIRNTPKSVLEAVPDKTEPSPTVQPEKPKELVPQPPKG